MRARVLLSGASVCLILLAAANAFAQDTFRWRDSPGVVHYSNLLPQDAVDHGYEVLDSRGAIIKRVPPPLTPQQRAAAEAEARRLENEAAARAAQARHDTMLLRTFDSVHDIERLRDNRLSALDARMRLVREHQKVLEQRLAALQAREARISAGKHAVSAELRQEASSLRAELTNARQTRRALETERADTQRRFEADIARFKQLQAEGRVPQ